jgi:hypothetical protein
MKLNQYSMVKLLIKIYLTNFYKSFNDLNITIKDANISIKNTNTKQLVNNIYLPPKINQGYNSYFNSLINKFKNNN